MKIPKKIKVGFNIREDTYTKKLGYVIYFDGKVWRKEKSWEGWRQKEGQEVNTGYYNEKGQYVRETKKLDSDINPIEFENVPTEGFVLNKKAGGGSSGWNHRNTYCRVYDPRGFEFEITIPNLLFILQESSSFKGKGLEGEFVYSWDGKDLVLLPASCEEYKQSENFTELQTHKIGAKDLVPGCSYKTKRQEDLIYLGRFNWYNLDWNKDYNCKKVNMNKFHIFVNKNNTYETLSSLTSLALKNNDVAVSNYAELMDDFSKSKYSSRPIKFEEELYPINFQHEKNTSQLVGKYFLKTGENTYESHVISPNYEYENSVFSNNQNVREYVFKGYFLTRYQSFKFVENVFTQNNIREETNYSSYSYRYIDNRKRYTKEELEAKNFVKLFVILENQTKIEVEQY